MCSTSQFISFFTVFACAALFGAGSAEAAYIEWEGGGAGNRDGVFGDANNWNTGQVPGTNDYARFLISDEYTVSFDAPATNNAVQVNDGTVTFNLGGHVWVMEPTTETACFDANGDEADKAVAILTNGCLLCKGQIRPASITNKYGTVTFRGADATFSSVFALVGSRGDGTLRLEQGATGIVYTLRLGWYGGNGYLDVRDRGSHIFVTENMDATFSGSGGVTISNEGSASFTNFYMRRGSILLDDGTLDVRRDIQLGYAGDVEGDVSIIMRNGAVLNATRHGRFGFQGSSNVTGRIESGSRLVTQITSIGLHPGSAEMTVTGVGSRLEAPGGLYVANGSGSGRLTVADGGQVVSGGEHHSLYIAMANTNAVGEVIVTGSGSKIVGYNNVLMAGNQYAPGSASYIKGGQALLALRAGGRLSVVDDPDKYLDIRVQEAGTVELAGGFLNIRRFRFHSPDGLIATNAGTLRVILHPEQANADEPMAATTGTNELNGARLELDLAPGFKPQLDDTFKVIGGVATAPPVGAFTWQGEEIADGDVLMLDKYGFRADISGNNFTLTTVIAPPSGTIFSIR